MQHETTLEDNCLDLLNSPNTRNSWGVFHVQAIQQVLNEGTKHLAGSLGFKRNHYDGV